MAVNIKKDFSRNKADLSALTYGKIPPQQPDLEKALLGILMQHKEIVPDIMDIIPKADCFYMDSSQKIYQSILDIQNSGSQVDLLMVTVQLTKKNELELVGGAYYLSQLCLESYRVSHAEGYARAIMEKFVQRELIRISGKVISESYSNEADVFDILGNAEYEINALHNIGDTETMEHIQEGVKEVLEDMNDLQTGARSFMGIDTGVYMLTELTKGWQDTDFIVEAARPSQGKTALSLQHALTSAMNGSGVAIFSLEMGKKQLTQRLISCHSGIELEKIKTGKLTHSEQELVNRSAASIASLPIFIDDRASSSIQRICNKIKMLVRKGKIKFALIDYLQLCSVHDTKGKNREQQISEVSRLIKITAKDCHIPIIGLSQMNRGIDVAKRKPELSDLRESGAIEQDADIVIFIHHEDGKSYLLVRKHRNGECGEIEVVFKGAIQKFIDPNEQIDYSQFKSFSSGIKQASQNIYNAEKEGWQ